MSQAARAVGVSAVRIHKLCKRAGMHNGVFHLHSARASAAPAATPIPAPARAPASAIPSAEDVTREVKRIAHDDLWPRSMKPILKRFGVARVSQLPPGKRQSFLDTLELCAEVVKREAANERTFAKNAKRVRS